SGTASRQGSSPAEMVERAYPGLEIARDVAFAELWQFFKDTNFLYPEKLVRLEPELTEIERTMTALLADNGRLLETVVLRENGVIQAHLCALRSHSGTWSIQHLAARRLSGRSLQATARLNLAIAKYLLLRPDVEWVRIFFRPNNPFPARLYGGC